MGIDQFYLKDFPLWYPKLEVRTVSYKYVIIIIIYPLTARVVGAPQIISQPVSFIFPCSPLALWDLELQACTFPDVFPPLALSALSSSSFQCALQDFFGQT